MSVAFKTEAGRDAVHAAYRALLADWPVPSEQLRVATRHGDTFVVACGPKDAPPLVVLHGAQANAAACIFDAASWSKHFRVYAIDVIGEAGLSAEVRLPLDTEAHARWLDDVLDGLEVPRAAFVGTSLGGWFALDYATRRPKRVGTLALLCPAGIGRQKNFLLKALPLLLLGAWGMKKTREMVFGTLPVAVTAVERRFVAFIGLIGRHIKIRNVRIPRLSDAELAALPRSLVVIGGKDVLIDSVDTRARLESHCPQATIHFVPDGRHVLPRQTEAVLEFLQSARDTREDQAGERRAGFTAT
jgi:pimeloyl-ACP methyl ester carboxylesterase